MSEKCLERLAAHGLEILLALNSSSCDLLKPAYRSPSRILSTAGATREKRRTKAEQTSSQDESNS
ncbi:MAG: hypothetical protein QXN26_02050 [Thermoplasmataceae archaeon]